MTNFLDRENRPFTPIGVSMELISTTALDCRSAGNYHEYEEDTKKRLGEEGAKPKRIRYKPITR